MFQACEPAHGAATPTAAQSSDTRTKHTQIKNHVMRASTLTFIATWTRWAGSWEEGGGDGQALCTWLPQVISGETRHRH